MRTGTIPETSLCVLPWIHAYIGTMGFVQLCCVSGTGDAAPPVFGTIRHSSLLDIFNSEPMHAVRSQMISGTWPPECSYCRDREARGLKSSRQFHNEIHQHTYKQIISDEYLKPTIRSLDIRLNNICNFKCRSCSGFSSSRWGTEHHLLYPHNALPTHIVGLDSVSTFWDEFNNRIKPNLKYLHIAGGEPLVCDVHYQLLENLIASGQNDVALYYDTNLSQLRFKHWDAVELWRLFPQITLSLSLDGVGSQGEYIRHGLDYEQWQHNLDRVKQNVPHVKFKMHFVVSVFNVIDLQMHIRTIIEKRFTSQDRLRLTFLRWPPYLSVQMLPASLKVRAVETVQALIEHDVDDDELVRQLQALTRFIRERDLYQQYRREFVSNTILLDQLRRENVLQLFPYLTVMFQDP